MRGIRILGDRTVVLDDFPDPVAGSGEVVVAMKVTAICGSDLHKYRATSESRQASGLDRFIAGHEPSGEVVEVGSGVQSVRVGDRVAVYHYRACGHCHQCLGGNLMWCPDTRAHGARVHGANADFLVTDARNCLPLPSTWSYERAVFTTCVASTAFEALTKMQVSGAGTIVVWGLGPVGLTGVVMAKAMGARVLGLDPLNDRREFAHHLGADHVIDPASANPVEWIYEQTSGQGATWGFETSGSYAAQSAAPEAAARSGMIVIVGHGNREPSILPSQFINKQLQLVGSFVSPIQTYWQLVEFIDQHDIQLEQLVTHRFAIDDAEEAFRSADTEGTGKILFTW